MRNRSRGGSEAAGAGHSENDKVPCTSKFHFSKGKYGHIVLAWHGVLVRKAKANFQDICAQARKIFGVKDIEVGNGNKLETVNPEIRTRVGLDSESESEEDELKGHGGDDENHGNDDTGHKDEDDRITGIDLDNRGDDGNNDDVDEARGNDQYEADAGPSRSVHSPKYDNRDVDAEKNYGHGGKVVFETEEVDHGGPSCHGGGHHGAKASRGRRGGRK
jgi:hypothetical protein